MSKIGINVGGIQLPKSRIRVPSNSYSTLIAMEHWENRGYTESSDEPRKKKEDTYVFMNGQREKYFFTSQKSSRKFRNPAGLRASSHIYFVLKFDPMVIRTEYPRPVKWKWLNFAISGTNSTKFPKRDSAIYRICRFRFLEILSFDIFHISWRISVYTCTPWAFSGWFLTEFARGKRPIATRQRFQLAEDQIHWKRQHPICWDIPELVCNPNELILISLTDVVGLFNHFKWSTEARNSCKLVWENFR